ncbi:CGNR zinc finger domain-containing protein [Spirillospora sp. NPDC127506]|jgi:predicted RNA-binding Zn ribbon-like protein
MRELPAAVRPVVDFLNTIDVEDGTDVLRDGPEALANWLVEHGLCAARPSVTTADVRAAIDLRRGLRSLALANNGEPVDAEDVQAAQTVPTALTFRMRLPTGTDAAGPDLLADDSGSFSDALGRIAAAYFTASVRGGWARVRRCPAHDCAWVFWDSSKNASRRWCSMRVCGNRAKKCARSTNEERSVPPTLVRGDLSRADLALSLVSKRPRKCSSNADPQPRKPVHGAPASLPPTNSPP